MPRGGDLPGLLFIAAIVIAAAVLDGGKTPVIIVHVLSVVVFFIALSSKTAGRVWATMLVGSVVVFIVCCVIETATLPGSGFDDDSCGSGITAWEC